MLQGFPPYAKVGRASWASADDMRRHVGVPLFLSCGEARTGIKPFRITQTTGDNADRHSGNCQPVQQLPTMEA